AGPPAPAPPSAPLVDLDPLTGQDELFDGEIVAARVEARPGPLTRPAGKQVPRDLRAAGVVKQRDGDVMAFDGAFHRLLAPFPQLAVRRDAAAERDVGVGDESGKLAYAQVLVRAFPVFHRVLAVLKARAFTEAGPCDAVQFDGKVVAGIGIEPVGHGRTSSCCRYAVLVPGWMLTPLAP